MFCVNPLLPPSSSARLYRLTETGDLLNARGKTRKTSSKRHNSNSSQGSDGSSDRLFIEEQPAAPKHVKKNPKARKSEPVKRVTADDEYAEDEGRMETPYVFPSNPMSI